MNAMSKLLRSSRGAVYRVLNRVLPRVRKHRWQLLFAVAVVAVGTVAIIVVSPSDSTPQSAVIVASSPTPEPAPSGLPDPRTAGLVAGTTLTVRQGDVFVVHSDTQLLNLHITGSLYIMGPVGGPGVQNILVDNVRVDGCIFVNMDDKGNLDLPVPSHITFLHLDGSCFFGSGFDDLTLNAVNLHDSQNSPQAQIYDAYSQDSHTHWPATNLVVENSWFHGFRTSTTAAHLANLHIGGIQTALIRNNRFELSVDAATWAETSVTAPFEIDPYAGSGSGLFSSNITFDHNYLYGDSYFLLYFIAIGDSSVTNNQFYNTPRHDYVPFAGVQYFAYSSANTPGGVYPTFHESGNMLDGVPVTLPGGE